MGAAFPQPEAGGRAPAGPALALPSPAPMGAAFASGAEGTTSPRSFEILVAATEEPGNPAGCGKSLEQTGRGGIAGAGVWASAAAVIAAAAGVAQPTPEEGTDAQPEHPREAAKQPPHDVAEAPSDGRSIAEALPDSPTDASGVHVEPTGQGQGAASPASEVPAKPQSPAAEQSPADGPVEGAEGQGGPGAPAGSPEEHLTEDQVSVSADKVFMQGDALAAEGHVVVRTKDFTITADRVEIDRRNEVACFRGNVVITGQNQETRGRELWLDLDSGWWRIVEGATKVEPEFFTGNVLEPLYAKGASAEQEPDSRVIAVTDALATSCDLAVPHYCLRSTEAIVRPNDKLTLRRPALYLFGHRVLRYPFDVTVSLREERQKIIPEIGSNEVEGRYLKFAFLYLMGAHNNGVARLHFTEKRGAGLGFDHLLEDHRQSLYLSMFNEPSEGALSLRASHDYVFGRTLRSDTAISYQRNSGYLYSSSTLTSDMTLRNVDADSDTSLGFQQSQTTSAFGSSRRFGSSFSHNQRLGRRTSWSVRGTYSSSRFATQNAADEELLTDFELRHQAHSYDVCVQANNRFDIDSSRYAGDDYYYGLYRLPILTISTDTDRLGGWRLLGRARTRAQLELGHFSQDPQGTSVNRAAFIADIGGSEQRINADTTCRTALRFRQSWFDDGSAQYFLSFLGELSHSIDGHWHTRISYDRSLTSGFAPLRVDYGGRSDEINWTIVRYAPETSRFQLSGGYDFMNNRYRDLRFEAEWRTSARSYYRLNTAYSIEASRWWPLVARYVIAGRDVYIDLNASYDIDQGKLSTITADTDLQLGRWWRLEFLGSYSGWTGTVDQAHVRLTRDLHCLIAQVVWSKWPRELSFNLGIKAFPSRGRPLGIGETGGYMPAIPGAYY